MSKERLEEIKEPFADLEKTRIEILQEKIQTGLNEFKDNPKQQWTELRLEKVLLETLLESFKQAKQTQNWKDTANGYYKRIEQIKEQNKRYREIFQKILDSTMTIKDYKTHSYYAERLARKALKKEE